MQAGSSVHAFLIHAAAAELDEAVWRLWELGTTGIEERPAAHDEVALLTYFQDQAVTLDCLREALAGMERVSIEPATVPDVDWVARFREGFRPFTVGHFRIAPVWDAPAPSVTDGLILIVDPGRAFGTGTHESTALCLSALERLSDAGPLGRVLDVGTGSGILAVAAARLGASHAFASDIDAESITSAQRHAALNGVALLLLQADGGRAIAQAAFDVVVANLTAPLLLDRAAELGALPRPGGHLVLSGLLDEECTAVQAAYEALGTAATTVKGEWASLTIQKRP